MRHSSTSPFLLGVALVGLSACGARQADTVAQPADVDPRFVEIVKYEKTTQQLIDTNDKLQAVRGKVDEQRRRLALICNDHPDHGVCQPQTQAAYARAAFCEDREFTDHVDKVVDSCHQGMCKQLDQAAMISRSNYMLLTTRLPHSLVTFGPSSTRLDKKDQTQLQRFVENIGAEGGYVIIVGRASKDGPWKKNVELAIKRAESTRLHLVNQLGINEQRAGYITYGHEKMYLTELDAKRLTKRKLNTRQANRSALVFAYPCFNGKATPVVPELTIEPVDARGAAL
ncbi:MAG: outer membrane protein OmpA-like peptidoglycan-associated protein [Bradymonadia bacterium]|jgi:outer membrane protein OmpA-like peptidoglycan-associated protein